VAYDPTLNTLVSNPVKELVNLRNGTLASEKAVSILAGSAHVVAGTGFPADASTSDVVLNITVPAAVGAVGVSVLANVSAAGTPFGGVLVIVNFTTPDANGIIAAVASIRTLNPCGSGSSGHSQATFPILKGEKTLDIRVLVDRSVIEVRCASFVFKQTQKKGVGSFEDAVGSLTFGIGLISACMRTCVLCVHARVPTNCSPVSFLLARSLSLSLTHTHTLSLTIATVPWSSHCRSL
jgi:hypothetical protein